MNLLLISCQLILTVVFLVSAIFKVRDIDTFAGRVRPALPSRVARHSYSVGVLVVFLEFATVVLLLFVPYVGFLESAVLLIAFTVHLVRVIRSGVQVPCGCAGSSEAPTSRVHVVRNLLLLVMAVTGSSLSALAVGHLQLNHLVLLGPATIIGLGILYLQELTDLLKGGILL
ncbi:MauE/DoxX family redox-associated membrane protein [Streptomyces sp. NPDC002589]|uniref:MauE/DoxX family redox-associated membrane protein n=1 Tax=Streptomyces sp. NPDC002589 TaxID=3154420 RepID=UPI0033338CE0